jgi:hypothetical protein
VLALEVFGSLGRLDTVLALGDTCMTVVVGAGEGERKAPLRCAIK